LPICNSGRDGEEGSAAQAARRAGPQGFHERELAYIQPVVEISFEVLRQHVEEAKRDEQRPAA